MQDDLEIITGMDQSLPFNPQPLLNDVEKYFMEAKLAKNVHSIFKIAKQLITGFRMSGLALAKLLYMLEKFWQEFEVTDEFIDVAYAELGISQTTIDRYISVWRLYEEELIPEGVRDIIEVMPLKSQIPIATAIKQGYELTEDDWGRLAQSADETEVRQTLRDIKGQIPRKGGLTIKISRQGDLIAYMDGDMEMIGYLKLEDRTPLIQKAIERIINNSSIIKE